MKPSFLIGSLLLRLRPAPLAVFFKSLLRIRRRELVTDDGVFWVDPASNAGQRMWRSGAYDAESSALLKRILKPGDTFLDVGANEGCLAVPAARLVGPAGRVVAVEPQIRLHPILRRNRELNAVQFEILAAAISDRSGMGEIHLTPDVNNSASGLTAQTRYKLPTQSVDLLTLDELFARLALPSRVVMKMDIEGFEYEAILGSPELFRSGRIPHILLELHSSYIERRGLDPAALPRFLTKCGYQHLPNSHGHVWSLPGQS